jgi:hypothetical protein
VPSERCSIEEQSIEYCDGCVMSSDVVRGDLWSNHVTRHNTPIPEEGTVMPKHVGATVHN